MIPGNTPVGIFDSGVGGLSVVREIRRILPEQDLIYVSDARYLPYGDRDAQFVCERSLTIASALIERGAGMLVVACNTATAAAAHVLRTRIKRPVVAIEPAVKPAAAVTRSGVIGVLATAGTLGSERYADLIRRYGQFTQVINQPCPGLVECVESLPAGAIRARNLLERYVRPLVDAGVDTLVLGCTHYPFLSDMILEFTGPEVQLIDPGHAVAKRVASLLTEPASGGGRLQCYTSGNVGQQQALMSRLLGTTVTVDPLS